MNRSQRRYGRGPPKRNESEGRVVTLKNSLEIEEVYSPKVRSWRNTFIGDKNKTNRCTSFQPSSQDFGQLTETDHTVDNYQNILQEQFGFEPSSPDTIHQLKELKRILCQSAHKVESSSQFSREHRKLQHDVEVIEDTSDESQQWQNVDTTEDLSKFIPGFRDAEVQDEEKKPSVTIHPTRIHISESPRVKVIAAKFSKFKRNNIELRRLEEKVVCLEYDIFDMDMETTTPFQKMRAFFSIKPIKVGKENENEDITMIPSDVKRNYDIVDEDIEKLDKKEIEVIDGKIAENRSLLEDLKKLLKRKQTIHTKKKQPSLDLKYLYEVAKRESPPLDEDYSNTNLLSSHQLQEIKDLILKKCASSAHGISRRRVKCEKRDLSGQECVISNSLASELIREAEKDTTVTDL